MSFLKINNLRVAYGNLEVLFGVDLEVPKGGVVTLLGSNGAGKTTIVKTICGVLKPIGGEIFFDGQSLQQLSARERVNRGIVLVPEGRLLFPSLSVMDNLRVGAMNRRGQKNFRENLERAFVLFPALKERPRQFAGTLSGGEQQMLAISRGLMASPRLLMLDEPSLGLAPILVKELFNTITEITRQEITVLLIEQNVSRSLEISDMGYVLENGHVVLSGSAKELAQNKELKRAYMGI